MRKSLAIVAFVVPVLFVLAGAGGRARAEMGAYPAMAPLDQYLMPKDAEIALARSAAPASIADHATVMVLERQGYTVAVPGTNGFVCYVERSWAKTTDDPEFWNPKMRAPNCFNEAAVRSITPIYLMKSRLVLAGDSRAQIAQTMATALNEKKFPALEPGAMCYMMSKDQYLNDQAKNWYPHVMFYVSGDAAPSWGANLPGSPIIAANDAEARVTVMMVVVRHWSDGTPGPH
ncbi:MAG: hypothetical protein WA399_05485 [Acidobacteriaceae bacterium]